MAPNLTIPSSALITGETSRAEAAETLRPTANSPLSDPIGRTQVLGTSTIAAPSLRQFVFVDDAGSWGAGAKGDANRVTDGAITSGTNQLSSVNAAFTTADVGKTVEIVGAAASGGNLAAFIGGVSGGVASLYTTTSYTTHSNASTTVSGATVTYATDDSSTLQSVASAVSNAGGGIISFSPFKKYWLTRCWPLSNITYDGNRATFYCGARPASGLNTDPMFWNNTGLGQGVDGTTNVTFKNWNIPGHGAEQHDQLPWLIGNGINYRFYDNMVTNNRQGAIYVSAMTGIRVKDNDLINCCTMPNGFNPLNVSCSSPLGSTYPANDAEIIGNRISGQVTQGIDIAGSVGSTSTQTTPLRIVCTDNFIVGAVSGSNDQQCIWVEVGGSGVPTTPIQKIIIANNICVTGGIYVSDDSTPASQNPTLIGRMVIAGNSIDRGDPVAAAILYEGSYGLITGNEIQAPNAINVLSYVPATTGLAGDFTNGSAIINNVTGGGSVTNGELVGGLTGIASGTYLINGAGTTTWTLSTPFTGTGGLTQAFTVTGLLRNNHVTNNICHIVTAPTGGNQVGISLQNCRNSTVTGNQVTYDQNITIQGQGIIIWGCGWVRVRANDIDYAPGRGMDLRNSHDLIFRSNSVYNPSSAAAGSPAIYHSNLGGTSNLFADNDLIDDRSTHLMSAGITSNVAGSTASTNMRIRSNTILGTTGNPVDNLTSQFNGVIELRNNITDKPTTFPAGINAITVGANPYTYTNTDPYPQQVLVSGGTVSQIQISRNNGTTFFTTGATGGPTMMLPGDQLKVTYTAAPVMDKVPLW